MLYVYWLNELLTELFALQTDRRTKYVLEEICAFIYRVIQIKLSFLLFWLNQKEHREKSIIYRTPNPLPHILNS